MKPGYELQILCLNYKSVILKQKVITESSFEPHMKNRSLSGKPHTFLAEHYAYSGIGNVYSVDIIINKLNSLQIWHNLMLYNYM